MASFFRKRSRAVPAKNGSVLPASAPNGPFYLLRIFALVVVGIVIQTTIASHLMVLGAKPGLALVMIVCLALIRGPVWGAMLGFAAGLMIDVALMQTLGISSFLYTLAGYFSGRYGERVDSGSWIPPLLTVFVSTLVVQFLNAVGMFLLGVEASASFVLLRVILPAAVLNSLLAPLVFVVTSWWLGGEKAYALFTEQ